MIRQHRVGADVRFRGQNAPTSSIADFEEVRRAAMTTTTPKREPSRGVLSPIVVQRTIAQQRRCQLGRPGCEIRPTGVIRGCTKDGHYRLLACCDACADRDGQEDPR